MTGVQTCALPISHSPMERCLLDDVAVKDVSQFEAQLHHSLQTSHKHLLEELVKAPKFTPDLEKKLKDAIMDFKEGWSK